MARSRMPPFPKQKHRCSYYGLTAIFTAPNLAGLQYLGCSEAEGQCYGSPKNAPSEANCLAIVGQLGDVAAKLPRAQTALREDRRRLRRK